MVRFTEPAAESAASLAMRDGDPAGIAFYIDHDRVHVGADQTAADMAYAAWVARHRSRARLNPVGTHQRPRRRTQRTRPPGPAKQQARANIRTVTLADGLTASAGDWIATRNNARWLHFKGGKAG